MKISTKLFSFLIFILVTQASSAASVIRDGKEWMQLTSTEFAGTPFLGTPVPTYNDLYSAVSTHCDTGSGLCSSGTNTLGESLNGWTWASAQDVRSLFNSYISETHSSPTDIASPSTGIIFGKIETPSRFNHYRGSTWAPLALSEFDSTTPSPTSGSFYGLTRTTIGNDKTIGFMRDSLSSSDLAEIYTVTNNEIARSGVFLYKNVSAVPVPATAILFAPALLGFMGFRRKLQA